ncbi:MAG: hypothetical protein Q7V31_06860 [Parvibaculum sp.]|uniref:hypothetical protein n=1 Tax=Parvibaculum sp. TaxID=2024848 RepID=UPI002728B762|nr:hypothetical protein [Parvibaculum sp.]MDO8838633.1 hypothetical protein [Parvibaculum sp.]
MTTAQHPISPIATEARPLGAGLSARASRFWTAAKVQAARTCAEFNLSDATAAAGYTLLWVYSAGLIVYIAGLY